MFIGLGSNHLAAMVERRRAYERGLDELRESRHRIMLAHEQTRKEVAGLIHGRVQSRMVVLGHWLTECQDRLKDGPGEVFESLDNVKKLLNEIRDQELRSITRQLYPSIIRTGLPSALNSLADGFSSVFAVELGIDEEVARLERPVKPSFNEPLRLGHRVAEEALSNVAKHSHAQEARVSLSLTRTQEVLLVVQDEAMGSILRRPAQATGFYTMEDYVTALGGSIEVKNALGTGTMITVSVPVTISQPSSSFANPDNSPGPN